MRLMQKAMQWAIATDHRLGLPRPSVDPDTGWLALQDPKTGLVVENAWYQASGEGDRFIPVDLAQALQLHRERLQR